MLGSTMELTPSEISSILDRAIDAYYQKFDPTS